VPSYTAGTAYVRIAPSMAGFQTALRNEIRSITPEPTIDVRINPVWRGGPIPPIPDQTVNVRAEADQRTFATVLGAFGALGAAAARAAAVPALAAVVPIVASIGAAAVTSAGSLLLIPAAATAATIAVNTYKLGVQGLDEAFKNMDDPAKFAEALADLAPNARAFALEVRALRPAWTELRLDVQNALFRNMGTYVNELGSLYLPVLRQGLTATAGSLNLAAGGITDMLGAANRVEDVRLIFDRTAVSTRLFAQVADTLVGIFLDIAAVGADFLPGLAGGFANAVRSAGEYVHVLRETGRLHEIIANGLVAVRDLGDLFGNIGGIISTVWAAATAGGNSLLGTMIATTGAARDFLSSAEGFNALVTIFTTIRTVFATLLPVAVQIAGVVAQVISIIGPAIPPIAVAFAAVLSAVLPLVPVLAEIASVIAQALAGAVIAVAPLVRTLAEVVGSILLAALRAIQPIFPVLISVIERLAPPLQLAAEIIGGVVVRAIQTLAPSLPPLVGALGDFLVAVVPLVVVLAEMASVLSQAVLPLLPVLLDVATRLIRDAFIPMVPPLIEIVRALLPGMVAVLNILIPVLTFVVSVLADQLVMVMQTLVIPAMQAVAATVTWLAENFQTSVAWISDTWTAMGAWIDRTWNGVVLPVFNAIVDFIRNVLQVAFDVLWTVVRIAIGAIGAIIVLTWNTIIKPIWDAMVAFATNVLGPMFVWLNENVVQPVWNAIQTVINAVWTFIRDNVWNPIVAFIQGVFAPVFEQFEADTSAVWRNVGAVIDAVWVAIRDNVWNPLVNFITVTIPDAFRRGTELVGQLWDGIKKTMRDPVQAVIDVVYNRGIVASWNAIADFIGLGGQKLAPFTLPAYAAGGPVTRPTALLAGEAGPEYILSAPAVRSLGGVTGADNLHKDLVQRRVYRDIQAGRLVEGADHDGPGARRTGFGGVRAHVAMAGHYLAQRFGIGSVGGVGSRPNASDHPAGLALDFMTRGGNGDALAGFLSSPANWTHFGVKYQIWKQRIMSSPGNWRGMADRGSATANHFDHVHVSFQGGPGGGPMDGGGGGAAFDPIGFVMERFGDVGALLGQIAGVGPYVDIIKGFGGKIFTSVRDFAVNKVTEWVSTAANAVGGFLGNFVGTGPGGSGQDAVRAAASRYGWGGGPEWNAIAAIVQRESGFNPNAQNPTSTAYGLFQFLNGTWAGTGIAKTSDPAAQSEAGMRYIRQRYGTPLAALRFRNANGWYDQGGLAAGRGIMMKDIISPERVLSARQTRAFELLVDTISPGGARLRGDGPGMYDMISAPGSSGGAPFIGSLTVPVPDGSTIEDTLDAVFTRAGHEARSGSRYSRPGA
jgi:phage-related protein